MTAFHVGAELGILVGSTELISAEDPGYHQDQDGDRLQ